MAEKLGNVTRAYALRKQQRRGAVPQVVEPDRREWQLWRLLAFLLWLRPSDGVEIPEETTRVRRRLPHGPVFVGKAPT